MFTLGQIELCAFIGKCERVEFYKAWESLKSKESFVPYSFRGSKNDFTAH